MGCERLVWLALVTTSVLIILVEAQGTTGLFASRPTPGLCNGSRCSTDICRTQGLSCCRCKSIAISSPDEVCACCPSNYSCCNSSPQSSQPTCCPLSWSCDTVFGGCTRLTASIPSTAVCSPCDRMYLSIAADDAINDLFIDGVSYKAYLGTVNTWSTVRTIEIPADTKVIATNCSDLGRVVAGVLASTTNNYFRTSAAWKCTAQTTMPDNWMQPTFNDLAFPNAVEDDFNDGSNMHGILPGISSTAAWIWTQNYAGPIDTQVYCRGYFPTASCNLVYGRCSNLCSRERGETCCGCELNSLGPSMVCNCCPRGYKCCGITGKPRCCPLYSSCRADGQCLEGTRQVSAQFSCSSCGNVTTTGITSVVKELMPAVPAERFVPSIG